MPQNDLLFERLINMTGLLSPEQLAVLRAERDAGRVPSLAEGARVLGMLDAQEIEALHTLSSSISFRRAAVHEQGSDQPSAAITKSDLRAEQMRASESPSARADEPAADDPVLTKSFASLPSFRDHPRTIGGYELVERLARGSHGIVIKARRIRDGVMAALKVLPLTMVNDESQIERFRREVDTVKKLSHPNVVKIFEFGSSDDYIFYAMELLPGPSVREMIDRRGRIPHFEAAEYAIDAARGLGSAHALGIIHRDVKPSNLMLDSDRHIQVVDFGVAYEKTQITLTRTGLAPGTPAFMSPEQIQGDMAIDERSDIYSLGVTLYEMLSGKRPFNGKSQYEVMRAVLFAPVVRVNDLMPHLPREICEITHRAMAKHPDERYASMDALILELKHFLDSSDE